MARPSLREEIVEAALKTFHARGFNAAGVKDITDAAGAPKGSFYNHFESKEALAVVALEQYGARSRLEDLTNPDVEPLTRLRGHFEYLRDEVTRTGFTRGCMYGNFGAEVCDHNATIRSAVQEGLHTWTGLIASTIAEAQANGSVRPDLDAPATARFVLNAWEGTLIGTRADQSADSFNSFFRLVFDTLLTPST